jgi:predicted permease
MTNTNLLALAPIFFVLALGYGAGRLRVVDNKNVDSLNAVVMNFSLPASLLEATASAPRGHNPLATGLDRSSPFSDIPGLLAERSG